MLWQNLPSSLLHAFLAVRVKGCMSLRNGVWHELRNGVWHELRNGIFMTDESNLCGMTINYVLSEIFDEF